MATAALYARVDSELKEKAEAIMSKPGVTPSSLIQMVYSSIVLREAIPVDLKLPKAHPWNMDRMTSAEISAALNKSAMQIEDGLGIPLEEAFQMMDREAQSSENVQSHSLTRSAQYL